MARSAQQQQRPQQAAPRQQPAGQPSADGLPPEPRIYTPFPFNGLNNQASPLGIDDDQFVQLENAIIHDKGQLHFLPSTATVPLYGPSGSTISARFFVVLNVVEYAIVFLADGSAVQVRVSDSATTTIAAAATFTVSPLPPVVAVWQGKWLLIGTASAYYIWDGSILFSPGSLSPDVTVLSGGNDSYSSNPTVTISGGAGSGATATATADSSGHVTKVTITAAGSSYSPNDENSLVATFTGGGSSNKIAQGTVSIGLAGVTSITLTSGGTGYTNQPAVTLTGGGGSPQALAVALGQAGTLTQILLVTPGASYSSTPTVTIGNPATGSDVATAVATIGYSGINSVTVTDAGAGYVSTPTVVITDPTGNGTGAKATAVMSGATVASVNIVNPGYGYVQAIVTFVGGNPSVAVAKLHLMPNGGTNPVSATAIEVFKNRVWMVHGLYQFVSSPGSPTDFAGSNGGIILQISDDYISYQLYGLRQINGFLYQFGDSSVDAISNPQTALNNNVVTSTYTRTNVDPQVGCPWPLTIQPFGQGLVFANPNGIYALYGSRVEKISGLLDDWFQTIPGQDYLPSAAVVMIFGVKHYAITIKLLDPISNTNRQIIFLWNGARWSTATQDVAPHFLQISNPANAQFRCYLDDGNNIYLAFSRASSTLTKKFTTKFYGVESAEQWKQALRFYISAEQTGTFTVSVHTEQGDLSLGSLTYPGAAGPGSNNYYNGRLAVLGCDALGANGKFLGWTVTSTDATGVIDYMALLYVYYSAYYS